MSFLPWWNPESWNKTSLMLGSSIFAIYETKLLPVPTALRAKRNQGGGWKVQVRLCMDYALMTVTSMRTTFWCGISLTVKSIFVSTSPVTSHLRGSHVLLDAVTASNEEFARLRRQPSSKSGTGGGAQSIAVEPFGIHFMSLTKADGAA